MVSAIMLKFVPSHSSPVAMIPVRDRKGVSFSNLELLIPMGSTNVFLLFNHIISFCFCLAWADRNISLYAFFSWKFLFPWVRWRFLPGPVYWSLLKIASDFLVVVRSLMFVFISDISSVNFCHMTTFSIKPSPVAILLLELVSLSDEGP